MPPPIHMDVDSVRSVMELLMRERESLKKSLKSITGAVMELEEGEWAGSSANQFFTDYDDMLIKLNPRLDAMEAFAGRLWQAIADWEAASAKLD
ncbi:MAG: hypothetical protein JW748_03010 [Anaerolineales bacterium]|nr:hypothetical protein [Anaerolineales bacterium]